MPFSVWNAFWVPKWSFLGTQIPVFVAVLLSLVLVVKAKSAFLSAMMNNMGTAKETVNNFNKVSYFKHGKVISLISYNLYDIN